MPVQRFILIADLKFNTFTSVLQSTAKRFYYTQKKGGENMTDAEKTEFLKMHLGFLQGAAKDAAECEFFGDIPGISEQILKTVEMLHKGD